MNDIQLQVGPSSWDRDMQGLDLDAESENLAALGMHIAGIKDDAEEEEEEDEEEETKEEKDKDDDEEDEEEEDEPEELDELKELDRLEKELKQEDPALLVDEEE
jgi:hypothetical protein